MRSSGMVLMLLVMIASMTVLYRHETMPSATIPKAAQACANRSGSLNPNRVLKSRERFSPLVNNSSTRRDSLSADNPNFPAHTASRMSAAYTISGTIDFREPDEPSCLERLRRLGIIARVGGLVLIVSAWFWAPIALRPLSFFAYGLGEVTPPDQGGPDCPTQFDWLQQFHAWGFPVATQTTRARGAIELIAFHETTGRQRIALVPRRQIWCGSAVAWIDAIGELPGVDRD